MTKKEFETHKWGSKDIIHYTSKNTKAWFSPISVDFETGHIEADINETQIYFHYSLVEIIEQM